LVEWEKDAEERSQWDLQKNYITPKGAEVGTEEYRRWFMGVEEGKSFLYSANSTANPNMFDIGTYSAQKSAVCRVEQSQGKEWEPAELESRP
jgi:hypothetical protein